jgi:hypothetical protein
MAFKYIKKTFKGNTFFLINTQGVRNVLRLPHLEFNQCNTPTKSHRKKHYIVIDFKYKSKQDNV